jgi:hypothetical protein
LAHLAAEAASLVVQRAPDDKNSVPERPVGLDPQETFTKRDETRNVQNSVGIVKLNPVCEKKTMKERVRWKRKPPDRVKVPDLSMRR